MTRTRPPFSSRCSLNYNPNPNTNSTLVQNRRACIAVHTYVEQHVVVFLPPPTLAVGLTRIRILRRSKIGVPTQQYARMLNSVSSHSCPRPHSLVSLVGSTPF